MMRAKAKLVVEGEAGTWELHFGEVHTVSVDMHIPDFLSLPFEVRACLPSSSLRTVTITGIESKAEFKPK